MVRPAISSGFVALVMRAADEEQSHKKVAAHLGQPGPRRSTPEPCGDTVFPELSPDPRYATVELGRDPIRAFVHLAHGFGAEQWQARWDRGETIGLNERLPYGYFWARQDGC